MFTNTFVGGTDHPSHEPTAPLKQSKQVHPPSSKMPFPEHSSYSLGMLGADFDEIGTPESESAMASAVGTT